MTPAFGPSQPAVLAEGLHKRYGGPSGTPVLDGFDLTVAPGTVHGLLGPNGAGKTTAVRILATLLTADGGRAEVAGYDVARQPAQVRTRIGLVGQHAAVDEFLTGRQNLEMFGRLYHLGVRKAKRRAAELLERFGLTEAANRPLRHYSGGMRRRLDLAASLILAPAVLFLDEPTTGLDPHSRNELWQAVRSLAASGTTVLLTTQYLDEADQLADQISILAPSGPEGGRVIAEGTQEDLKARIGTDRIEIIVATAEQVELTARTAANVAGAGLELDVADRRVSVPVAERVSALAELVRRLDEADVKVEDIAMRRPTLDDAFLSLTGRRVAAAESDVGSAGSGRLE
ncbi:ABC-2 type transport system ATP-binding protein [Lipingzhangella halophila]|uniref:ABC-2 type transport system ATP-binding protein n=1 Tax=Lipingzhangella halophila TaxID=1783352 RepID=A0A7W7RJ56_9ACTN|nr:ATP-binding cassette domain-containing protein [Lipingzhangella halophila]MBB4932935.1 ABC-2 type transport system ATP-binding protein [Lipingzhangella halophila]